MPSSIPRPDKPGRYVAAAKRLEDAGQLAIAGGVLAEAERRFPTDEALFLHRSEFIERHHNGEAAFARWVLMANRFPGRDRICTKVAHHHLAAGRFQAADAVLAEALARMPDSLSLLAEAAVVARARGNLHEAARRWRAAIDRHPDWPQAILAYNATLAALAAQAIDTAPDDTLPVAGAKGPFLLTRQADADGLRDLFMRFESLGRNCQFGFLQREFGAEPLGLLRFGGMAACDLSRALDNDFAELMAADDAILIPQHQDYFLEVPRAGFAIHTLTEPADLGVFLIQMRRRLRYLARKLLGDLQAGEKIFVFKEYDVTEEEISAVHTAVRRHGAGHLLFVRKPDENHPTGSVEFRADRVYVGYIEPGGAKDKGFRDAWVKVCGTIADTVPAESGPGQALVAEVS